MDRKRCEVIIFFAEKNNRRNIGDSNYLFECLCSSPGPNYPTCQIQQVKPVRSLSLVKRCLYKNTAAEKKLHFTSRIILL